MLPPKRLPQRQQREVHHLLFAFVVVLFVCPFLFKSLSLKALGELGILRRDLNAPDALRRRSAGSLAKRRPRVASGDLPPPLGCPNVSVKTPASLLRPRRRAARNAFFHERPLVI